MALHPLIPSMFFVRGVCIYLLNILSGRGEADKIENLGYEN